MDREGTQDRGSSLTEVSATGTTGDGALLSAMQWRKYWWASTALWSFLASLSCLLWLLKVVHDPWPWSERGMTSERGYTDIALMYKENSGCLAFCVIVHGWIMHNNVFVVYSAIEKLML